MEMPVHRPPPQLPFCRFFRAVITHMMESQVTWMNNLIPRDLKRLFCNLLAYDPSLVREDLRTSPAVLV